VIHYLTVERDLAAGAPSVQGHAMLLVAGPHLRSRAGGDYRARRISRRRRGVRRLPDFCISNPCPARRAKRPAFSAIWRQTGGAESSLVGAFARKNSVIEQAAGKRVLHLATHGFFLDACRPRPERRRRNRKSAAAFGLALAGANESDRPGEGILTAEEIASLDLDGLEWVVLSACDTALGEIHAGEGVFGLRRPSSSPARAPSSCRYGRWTIAPRGSGWKRCTARDFYAARRPPMPYARRLSPSWLIAARPTSALTLCIGPVSWPPASGAKSRYGTGHRQRG
jgi:hypothetical protein